MPKTPAERQKKRYERKKDDPEFRRQQAEKQRRYRQANKERLLQGNKIRQRRKRERDSRARAMLETAKIAADAESPYSTRQAEGKAWKRVKDSLPHDKNKKIHMLLKMADEMGLTVVEVVDNEETTSPNDLEKAVYAFLRRDDISHMTPGRKDVRTVFNEFGEKVKMSKRVLMHTLRETHAIFYMKTQK